MIPKTILIVDDDNPLRSMLAEIIEAEGYHVLQAHEGQHALKILESHRVDLIVLDILMPEMDGLEVIRELRRNKQFHAIKIIAISGGGCEDGQTYAQLAEKLGADNILIKPFDYKNLIKKMGGLLAE